MKIYPLTLAFFCALIIPLAAGESTGPLQKNVPAVYSYASFDEAVHLIEQRTGLKVACPADIAEFMRTLPTRAMSPLSYNLLPSPMTAKEFLDQVCAQLALSWQYDAKTGTITLGLPRKSADSRLLSDLLNYVSPANTDEMNDIYRTEWGTAFYSLLSADVNMKVGWKSFILFTRENSAIYMGASSLTPVGVSRPVLKENFTTASGGKYVLLMLGKPPVTTSGRASVFYFCFKEDGTLSGAGWLNLGYQSLVTAGVEETTDASPPASNELHMALKGDGGFLLARFALDPQGLKFTHLIDARGKEVEPGDFGKSLMPGAAQP